MNIDSHIGLFYSLMNFADGAKGIHGGDSRSYWTSKFHAAAKSWGNKHALLISALLCFYSLVTLDQEAIQ